VKKIIIYLILFSIFSSCIYGQEIMDSILQRRNNSYLDYKQFQENMEVRTWINMVNLTDKANIVIGLDNDIIDNILQNEVQKNKALKQEIEKLKLEIILLQKEVELKEIILKERKYLYNVLIISIGIISILFLVMLILFIDRQTRYRNAKTELERLWRTQDDNPLESSDQQFLKLSNQLNDLGSENIGLKNKVLEMQKAIDKKDNDLKIEMKSKKLVEEEIKKLILQLKSVRK